MKRARTLLALPLAASLVFATGGVANAAETPAADNLAQLWGDAVDNGKLPELPKLPSLEELTKMSTLPTLPPPPSIDDIRKAVTDAQATIGNGIRLPGIATAWINNPTGENSTRLISNALAGIPDVGQRGYAQQIWSDAMAGLNSAQQKMALAQGAAQVAAQQFGEYSPQALAALRQITAVTLQLAAQAVGEEDSTGRDEAQSVFTREGARDVGNASVDNAVEKSERDALRDARKEDREAQRAAEDTADGFEDSDDSDASSSTTSGGSAPSGSDSAATSGGSGVTTPSVSAPVSRADTITDQNETGVLGDANLGAGKDIADADWAGLKETLSDLVGDKAIGVAAAPAGEGTGISAGTAGAKIYPASIIKIPIAMTVQKELDPEDKVKVTDDDIVGGTGEGLTAGEYTVSDLLGKMIRVSDNTATNALIKKLGGKEDGFKKINEVIEAADGNGVTIENLMMETPVKSTATANGMTNILKHLWAAINGTETDILTADQATPILEAMGEQENREKLPSQIDLSAAGTPDDPSEPTWVFNKTGENDKYSHDVGYIVRDGKAVAVSVTTELGDEGPAAIGEVGKAIYDWLGTVEADNNDDTSDGDAGDAGDDSGSDGAAAGESGSAAATTSATPDAGNPSDVPAAASGDEAGGDVDLEATGVSDDQMKAAEEYDAAAAEFITANKKVLSAVEDYVLEAYKVNAHSSGASKEKRDDAFEEVKEAQDDETTKWQTMKDKEEAAKKTGFTDEELADWRKNTASQMVSKRDLNLDSPDKDSEFNDEQEVRDAYKRIPDEEK